MTAAKAQIVGVLLAGGKSRRMGGHNKSLLHLGNRLLLDHVIERARPQVSSLIINTSYDDAHFSSCGLQVVADVVDGFAGPLAGVLTGLEWALLNMPEVRRVASFPCDAPFVPKDLVERLDNAMDGDKNGADMACAASGGRDHPVFALWPVSMAASLRQAVVGEGMRRMADWLERYKVARVEYAITSVDPFFNINTPQDLAEAERRLAISQ